MTCHDKVWLEIHRVYSAAAMQAVWFNVLRKVTSGQDAASGDIPVTASTLWSQLQANRSRTAGQQHLSCCS
jgi:hypothetical protein